MRIAIITLSREGARLGQRLAREWTDAALYVHQGVEGKWGAERFEGVRKLTASIFGKYAGLVYIAPCGVAIRAMAPHLGHKASDPAVVAVDVMGRWAVSLLSGHEGGANDLAVDVGNILQAEPIITTTTEACKSLIVGVGCRRGITSQRIVAAVRRTFLEAGLDLGEVRLISSVDIKAHEEGLLAAARELGIPLRLVSSGEIRSFAGAFERSEVAERRVNLPAVAEPAALLAGRRTQLIVAKTIHNGVTVAVAREGST
jgi:cobalt-precorrin 5A hydrolase